MITSIKKYFKDCKGVLMNSISFSKKHWKGTLVLGTIYSGLCYLWVKAYCNRKFKLDDFNILNEYFTQDEESK